MKDSAFCVREEALSQLKAIASNLEKSLIEATVLPILEPFLQEKDHALRITYYMGIQKLTKNLPVDLQKKVVAKVKDSAKDPSANVKLAGLEAMRALVTQMKDKSARVGIFD
jgi:uncharacterized membrane-anchored protein YjiN (DUF445 family)